MIRAINPKTGNDVDLDNAIVESECPRCGRWHKVDLVDLLTGMEPEDFTSFDGIQCYCTRCSKARQQEREPEE